MRLLRTDLNSGLCITEFDSEQTPSYAILSHTWEDGEVLFSDVRDQTYAHKAGHLKIQSACEQAQKDGYDYIWIDTCCIDKTSSAELSEAINSMWTYYQESRKCYAYLSDVTVVGELENREKSLDLTLAQARWFKRGWTLQELLAPREVVFVDSNWRHIGTKVALAPDIEQITGIDVVYLRQVAAVQSASIAKRMSWASGRQTRRREDVAYSLMGLFAVNMPMLYGEGARAFIRLQIEIMAQSDDQSLFAWKSDREILGEASDFHGLLADHPGAFAQSSEIVPYPDKSAQKPYNMTNRGLNIEFNFSSEFTRGPERDIWTVPLQCFIPGRDDLVSIDVKKIPKTGDQYVRVLHHTLGFLEGGGIPRSIYVKQIHSWSAHNDYSSFPFKHYFVLGKKFDQVNLFPGLDETVAPVHLSCDFQELHSPEVFNAQWRVLLTSSSEPRAFRIRKEAGRMATALILKETPSKLKPPLSVAILLGSIAENEAGFDICEWPVPIEKRKSRRPEHDLQACFNPKAMGTVITSGLWKFSVTTEERTETEEGRKLHLLNIIIGRDDDVRNASDSTTRSLASKILKRAKPQ